MVTGRGTRGHCSWGHGLPPCPFFFRGFSWGQAFDLRVIFRGVRPSIFGSFFVGSDLRSSGALSLSWGQAFDLRVIFRGVRPSIFGSFFVGSDLRSSGALSLSWGQAFVFRGVRPPIFPLLLRIVRVLVAL